MAAVLEEFRGPLWLSQAIHQQQEHSVPSQEAERRTQGHGHQQVDVEEQVWGYGHHPLEDFAKRKMSEVLSMAEALRHAEVSSTSLFDLECLRKRQQFAGEGHEEWTAVSEDRWPFVARERGLDNLS